MSTRFGARAFQRAKQFSFRYGQQRSQTTTAPNAEQSKLAAFWNSSVGPKTVHFWAPIMKVTYLYPLYRPLYS